MVKTVSLNSSMISRTCLWRYKKASALIILCIFICLYGIVYCIWYRGTSYWLLFCVIYLTVPPEITNITYDRTVNKGDTVILDCKATGYPAPTITWTRVSDNSVLRMPLTISGKQDEGTYKCTADNGFGKPASRNVSLTVQSEYAINAVKTHCRGGMNICLYQRDRRIMGYPSQYDTRPLQTLWSLRRISERVLWFLAASA